MKESTKQEIQEKIDKCHELLMGIERDCRREGFTVGEEIAEGCYRIVSALEEALDREASE